MIQSTIDPLLTERDLSVWLGISLPTLQRMRSRGGGPKFVRLSFRRVGYRPSDVEEWLVERTAGRIDEKPMECAQP